MAKKVVKYEVIIPINIGKYRSKVVCFIWEKKYQMLSTTQVEGSHAHTVLKTPKNGKTYMEIHFWKGRLGIDYVVHEFFHACINFSNILNYIIQTPFDQKNYIDEEIMARVQGRAVRMFYQKLYKIGIIEIPDFVKSKPLDK